MTKFTIYAGICAGLLLAPSPAVAQELKLYNWADYFAEDTIKNFEAETGIKVIYDVFDSNEILETKILTGNSGYDVVFPAAPNAARQYAIGALAKIDRNRLENYDNLDTHVLGWLNEFENGQDMAVPYTWGTIGVAYVPSLVEKALPGVEVTGLDLIFDPESAAKLAECGIAMFDSPSEVLPVVLNYLGHNPFTTDKAQLEDAEKLLAELRPHLRYVDGGKHLNDLASASICVAITAGPDAGLAAVFAEEAGADHTVKYVLPKEGTIAWIDTMAIPSDAANVDAAYAFIDYILRPEVIAAVSNYVQFANANSASIPHVDESITSDVNVYPTDEMRETLFGNQLVDPRATRDRTRLWSRFKTGN